MGRKVGSAVVGAPNWVNRTIFVGDNLGVLRGMNSASVDLVYLDPPFNSNRNYEAPIGSKAAGASFKDAWTLDDIDEAWLGLINERHPAVYSICQSAQLSHSKGMKSYLAFMSVRIIELHRILKSTGSLYLHCDDTAVAYLVMMMDAIFGRGNRRGYITWKRSQSAAKGSQYVQKSWGRNTDTILHYAKSESAILYGNRSLTEDEVRSKFPKIDEDGRRYNTATPLYCSSTMGDRPNLCYEWRGYRNRYPSGWRLSKDRMDEEYQKGNIVIREDGKLERRAYADNYAGVPVGNLWDDVPALSAQAKERTGYPTQKPLALLERIIQASSNEGDVVLDPFAGCATTCDAAERLGREWVGIDLSPKAYDLIRMRLERAADAEALFRGGSLPDVHVRGDIPVRSDLSEPIEYSTVKHKLFGIQEGRCNGCKHEFQFRNFEVDHVIAKAIGGTDNEENLQLLCGSCNRIKGKKSQEELMVRLKELKLVA